MNCLVSAVNFCEEHGVSRVGFRKKACTSNCHILRSDLCQCRVPEAGGWGFRQCSRAPKGNGFCHQHNPNTEATK